MKSWLRDDGVYQAIMNGALWIVVIAALSTTKWPQLGWLMGAVTAVLVVIVATVYWIAVVTNENDKPNSTWQRPDTQLSTPNEAQGQRNPAQEHPAPPQRREEILEAYLSALNKNLETIRAQNLEAQHNTYQLLRRRVAQILAENDSAARIWATNFDELTLRNWVVHTPHHGAQFSSLKSHRRAFTTSTLARIAAGEEETSGKVVVTVGSVRIEIEEDDPNKTTNVHITSPKTVVTTNVTDTAQRDQQRPQELSQHPPTTTIH
jgi:hypothetical protein